MSNAIWFPVEIAYNRATRQWYIKNKSELGMLKSAVHKGLWRRSEKSVYTVDAILYIQTLIDAAVEIWVNRFVATGSALERTFFAGLFWDLQIYITVTADIATIGDALLPELQQVASDTYQSIHDYAWEHFSDIAGGLLDVVRRDFS